MPIPAATAVTALSVTTLKAVSSIDAPASYSVKDALAGIKTGKIKAGAVIQDTAAAIQSNWASLYAQAGKISDVSATDGKAVPLTAKQWVGSTSLLSKVGVGTSTNLSLVDTAANITANVLSLNNLADKFSDVKVTGAQTFSLNATQLLNTGKLQAKLTGVSYTLADTAANIQSNWTQLANNIDKISTIKLSGNKNFALNVATAALPASAGLMAKLSNKTVGGLLTLTDSNQKVVDNWSALSTVADSLSAVKLNSTNPIDISTSQLTTGTALVAKMAAASVNVVDSTAAIQSNLTSLRAVSAKLNWVTSSDTTSSTLTLSGKYAQSAIAANTDGSISLTSVGSKNTLKLKNVNFLKFDDLTTFADTGDATINAMVSGGTNLWWMGDQQTATLGTTEVKPGVLGLSADSAKHELTYSFLGKATELPASASKADKLGYKPMTDIQKAGVRQAFEYLSSFLNLTFKESNSTTGAADINFGTNNQGSSAAYANPPNGSGDHKVFVMLANNQASNTANNSFQPGQYGWETLIHEIGHSLGLKHPGNYNAGGGGASGPFLPVATDNRLYSVMSYNQPAEVSSVINGAKTTYASNSANPNTYMLYDFTALQYLYGASNVTGNASQSPQTLTFDNSWKGMQTLWTPAGGVLDASKVNANNIIDFRQGAFSSIAIDSSTVASKNLPKGLTSFQTYFGFNNVALSYGSSLTQAMGGTKDDLFYTDATTATEDVVGGQGTDTLYLTGASTDWRWQGASDNAWDSGTGSLTASTGAFFNSTLNLTRTVSGIEKVKFYSASAAFTTHSSIDFTA